MDRSLTTPATKEAPIDFAAERKAAEWVLSVGGMMQLESPKGELINVAEGPLPNYPFVVRKIDFQSNDRVTDEGFKQLTGCRRLRELVVNSCRNLTVTGLQQLSPMLPLETLVLTVNDWGDDALIWSAQYKTLDAINCQHTNWTDRGIAAIATLPRLRVLAMDYSPLATDATLSLLANTTSLRAIGLRSCDAISPDGIASFLTQHPQLTIIILSSDYVPNPSKLVAVKGHPALEDISMNGAQLTDESVLALNSLKKLDLLAVGFGITDEVLARISRVSRVRSLSVGEHDTNSTASVVGWQQFRHGSALEFLEISARIPVTDEILVALSQIEKLKRLRIGLSGDVSRPSDAGIAKFRELRPDVHLVVDGKDYPATK